MEKICRQCSASFEITDEDLAFYDKVSPVFHGKKEQIPPPTLCPNCRLQRRMSFRNQIYVYKGVSSATQKPMMSMFPEDLPVVQMEVEEWFKDAHDPLALGMEWDPTQSLFSQMAPLLQTVPLYALSVLSGENSAFSNNASFIKNCYLIFNAGYVEDSLYCESIWRSKDCIDCRYSYGNELCYDCTWCHQCYNVQNTDFSENCSDSAFLSFCRGCKNCFGCTNLRNASFCFFNEQLSEEAYRKRLAEMDLSRYSIRKQLEEQFHALQLQSPRPHVIGVNMENCSGNFLMQSQNAQDSFFTRDAQNIRYTYNAIDSVRDCMDFTIYGNGAELLYECHIVGDSSYHLCFCNECWDNTSELFYCQFCVACQNCFGCIGLHRRKFCILNKQYTEEEYVHLVPQIIEQMRQTGEWGEFFPALQTTYPYNHSLAMRYFPLTKEEAQAKGFQWYDRETEDASKGIDASALPDGPPASDDPIIVKSALTGRAFKITSQEIKRYRQLSIPLPRLTYDERMEMRAKKLGGIRLYDRTCMKTGKPIKTTISPDEPWIVWDKDVYDQEFGG